jgi:hypothetical protein
MPRRTPNYRYDIHIVTTAEDLKKASAILGKKFNALKLMCRTQIEARSHYDQSTYVLFKQRPLFDKDQETYKKGFLTDDIMSHWGDLMTLSRFVDEYCGDDESEELEIHLSKSDLESFRMASFIAAFCLRSKRTYLIKTFEEKNILNMYEPPINESTQRVLFSIIDHALKHGDFPEFEQLRIHHFSNLPSRGKWEGAKDNKYVASLYASLRTLQRLDLIDKKFYENMRKMAGIKPTINGYLSIIFSEVARKFETSPVPEESTEQQPPDIEDAF